MCEGAKWGFLDMGNPNMWVATRANVDQGPNAAVLQPPCWH
jgi:hypothetical protein